jgi:putative ABC transport system substrate-binding protein
MARQGISIARRGFVAGFGAAWVVPRNLCAQQGMKRIGMVLSGVEADPEMQARAVALRNGLQTLGWTEGRNYRFEFLWPGPGQERTQSVAAEMARLAPDVIVVGTLPAALALRQATRTIPIVFVNLADPVGGGLVESLANTGGNITGFTAYEYFTASKWLELLKEISPTLTRGAFIFGENGRSGENFFRAIAQTAPSMGVEIVPVRIRDAETLRSDLDAFAQKPGGGLIAAAEFGATNNRQIIIDAAMRYKLPAVYPFRYYAADGGLAVYGIDIHDQYRRSASYVDRILKGANPATLPVQAPDKFELILNLKTAKAQGIELSPILLNRADEVIE